MWKVIRLVGLYVIAVVIAAPFASTNDAFAVTPVFTEYSAAIGPKSIVGGPDGALWFTSISLGGSIGRIATNGTTTLYPTSSFLPPSSSAPKDITAGPDGNLWFTVPASSSATSGVIGKITTAGIITSYPLSGQRSPNSITSGPDNKLWFTQTIGTDSSGAIGQISTGGYMIHFAYSSTIPNLGEITKGRDGALWFAETAGNGTSTGPAIGRITTGGYISRYSVPNPPYPSGGPFAVATGPDGYVWYTSLAGKVGRVAMDGVITEYPVASGMALDIVTGPDGNLWITMNDTNRIGRVDTSGGVTDYIIPTASSGPSGVTIGSDGAIWFTQNSANQIGKLTTPTVREEFATTSRPQLLIQGSDGALWYAGHGYKINRVSSAGIVTNSYSISSLGTPSDLTIGPDGALWFAVGTKVGRLTTSGALTSFSLPTNYSAIEITLGPDGALWLMGSVPGTSMPGIFRMTTTGIVTNYPLPASVASPVGNVTSGPDGAIWFSENAAGNSNYSMNDSAINRLDIVTGSVTRNVIPAEPGIKPWPVLLISGPDANLWFALSTQASLVKMSTSGSFTQYPAYVSDFRNLSVGPDGAIWYSLGAGTNKIGRMTTSGVQTTLQVLTNSSDLRGVVAGANGTMWYGGYSSNKVGKITLP